MVNDEFHGLRRFFTDRAYAILSLKDLFILRQINAIGINEIMLPLFIDRKSRPLRPSLCLETILEFVVVVAHELVFVLAVIGLCSPAHPLVARTAQSVAFNRFQRVVSTGGLSS